MIKNKLKLTLVRCASDCGMQRIEINPRGTCMCMYPCLGHHIPTTCGLNAAPITDRIY